MIPEPKWIGSEALRILHAQQLDHFGGIGGLVDENVVESALARPRNLVYRDDVDLADLGASYLCGLAQKQGFADGNKRTAVAAMLVFLRINGKPLHVPPAELYRLAMDVSTNRISEMEVAAYLRQGGHADETA